LEKNPFLLDEEEPAETNIDSDLKPVESEGEPREADFGDDENFTPDMADAQAEYDSNGDDSVDIEKDYIITSLSLSAFSSHRSSTEVR
jgi:hypothetical protein